MTTRRHLLMLAGATIAASATTACEPVGHAGPAAVRVPDVLVGSTRDGLAVVREGKLTAGRMGALSATGSTLCLASSGAGQTELDFVTADGTRLGAFALDGAWVPRVVSSGSTLAALAMPEGDPAHPAGREQTRLIIADTQRVVFRMTVPGVVEPDAFTADHQGLFVLEWLPARAPDHYRVRRLDFATGALNPLFTRDKTAIPPGAEEQMRGEGRTAVASPTGRVLYTLYTHQPDHRHTRNLLSGRPGDVHAFVHTLDTEQGWAYCVDLPEPFGRSPAAAHAVALTANGRLLFVADVAAGLVARISTETLTVLDVVRIGKDLGPAFATATDKELYLGGSTGVQVLDLDAKPVGRWVTACVRGLAASRDLARVYVARDGAVTWHDGATGAVSGEAALDGLTGLVRVA